MMSTVLSRLRREPAMPRVGLPVDGLIGDGERVFPCPGCSRQLVDNQGRCPGCGSLLVAGVLLRTAGFLVLVGCLIGMLGGAIVAGLAMAPRLAAGDAAVAATVNASAPPLQPSAATGPGAGAPAGTPAPPGRPAELPSGVEGGLLQIAAVNERLATYAVQLEKALAVGNPKAPEVAVLVRRMAADARVGGDAARLLRAWPPAGALAVDASVLYGSLLATATRGLAAPLSDHASHAASGRAVLDTLADLPRVAAAAREVTRLAGVRLPDAGTP
jgi:hypothetical protein